MELETLFSSLTARDLEWIIPVTVGVLVIVIGLIVGLISGITASLAVALLIGAAMTMTPLLLKSLQQEERPQSLVAIDLARSSAELTALNTTVINDLSRVVNSIRIALDGLVPMVSAAQNRDDTDAATRFRQSLGESAERLNLVSQNVTKGQSLLDALERDVAQFDNSSRGPADNRAAPNN